MTRTAGGGDAGPGGTLVLGVGGSGRTHRLRDIADPNATWLSATSYRPLTAAAVRDAAAGRPTALVIDDAQWADRDALDALIDLAPSISIVASMRPWPTSPAHRAFVEAMGTFGVAERLDRLDEAGVAGVISAITGSATSTDLVTTMLDLSGGVAGWIADAATTGFDGDLDELPDQTAAAVVDRVQRAGDEVVFALELAALDTDPGRDVGIHVAGLDDPDGAEAALRASGALAADGSCCPIVRRAIRQSLTSRRRREGHDQLARLLIDSDPAAAAEHLLSGSRAMADHAELLARAVSSVAVDDAERCLDLLDRAAEFDPLPPELTVVEATAAYWAGRHDVLGRLSPGSDVGRAQADQLHRLGFGIDVRDLRWGAAAERPVDPVMRDLAAVCIGLVPDSVEAIAPGSAAAERLLHGLAAVANGDREMGLGALVLVADDADRSPWDTPLGITPHSLAAMAALWIGDLPAATSVLDRAIELGSGGAGEARTHRLLHAYVSMLSGSSSDAMAVAEAGDEPTWPQRDRLLVAAIDAALARRSGDTHRLRDAWARSEFALLRPSSSWLLFDPVLELLTAGARIGDERRVAPVAVALGDQLRAMPASGAGPATAHWLDVQLGLARRDDAAVASAADALAATGAADPRANARLVAARHWADLAAGKIDEAAAMHAMDALIPVGDGWEASRLLGQTDLDHEDPQAARRLLEAARSLANDPADDGGNEGLVSLGLSEREAEVAVLVTEGKTHREVGATLFISPKTVEHHVAKIRQKLGAATRAEMMAVVRRATSGDVD